MIEQLKSAIEKHHEILSCYDYRSALEHINDPQSGSNYGYKVQGDTAIIKVRGLLVPYTDDDYSEYGLTGYNTIMGYLHSANDDVFVKNIVLDVDSGGGFVKGINAVLELMASINKPISAAITGNAYSAAYWLISGTNRIVATKDSGIGSIGAYVVHAEESKAIEKAGVSFSLFRSGTWKNAFNWFSPLSDNEKQRLQQGVDDTAMQFFSAVEQGRGVSIATVQDWQGDTFTASQARQLGLIDEINNRPLGLFLGENPMKLEELQACLAQKETELAQKNIELATAASDKARLETALANKQAELDQYKADKRQQEIESLASTLGKEFGTDEIKVMGEMSDAQFALLTAIQKPILPSTLTSPQATGGVNAQSLDDKVRAWANESQ